MVCNTKNLNYSACLRYYTFVVNLCFIGNQVCYYSTYMIDDVDMLFSCQHDF